MKSFEKQNDDLIKKIALAKGYCEWCLRPGTMVQLHHHHIITRNNKAYRHLTANILCLCAGCHTMSPCSAHKDLTAFVEWLKTTEHARWFNDHLIEVEEYYAGRMVKKWRPIKIKTVPDEEENEELKRIWRLL